MSGFQRHALKTLVAENSRPPNTAIGTKIWCLNLDQIESDTGRVLAKQIVSLDKVGASTYTFEAGTVLYSKLRPYLNKVVVADNSGVATTELVPLRCNPEKLLPHYLAYFLRSSEFLQFANIVVAGAKMPRMVMGEFWDYKIPVPPLPEQRRIVAILDQADALRTKRREALEQLDSFTQSIFIEMFGDPKTNPMGWKQKSLKDLGKVTTGGTPPSSKEGMFGGETPFVTPGDLESNAPVRRTLSLAGAEEVGTVRAGATLVCCIGATIGKIGQAIEDSAFNQQLNAVEWGSEIADDYGLEVMRLFKPTIIAWGASTTLPILKKSSFEKITIPVPPKDLQDNFAKLVVAQRQLAAKHRSSVSELNNLFESLQVRAFRGAL